LRRRGQSGHLFAILALSCSTLAASARAVPRSDPEVTPAAAQADFDALWRYVAENYAYFDSRSTDWAAVPALYKADLAKVRSRSELVGVLERVLDELCDAHAQLTVNTASSPRLVPSGADLWAEWREGRAIVTQVRDASDAERAGLRAGAEILALDSVAIGDAIQSRIGRSVKLVDDGVRSWSLRAVLAGRHGRSRRIRFRMDGSEGERELPAADQFGRRKGRMESRTLPGNVGYIRLNDSLGDPGLIPEFDAALSGFESSSGGLILDLRDTPSGGNTTVARAIMGRFVRAEKPYQKHSLPSEERRTGIRRSWLELVSPRGKAPFPQPVAVLVGRWTGSMGEGLAIGFDGTTSAIVVGTPMAGLPGATEHFELPRSLIGVNVPTEKLFHVNGAPRESFQPPVLVTLEELRSPDGDPWIRKAVETLSGTIRRGSPQRDRGGRP
jgi:C-terminal processing protease CtpA/Prc